MLALKSFLSYIKNSILFIAFLKFLSGPAQSAEYIPGEVMDEWKPNIPELYLKKDPTLKDSEKGYINFCCIDFKVESFEILELHHDGHIRFEIVHHDKGKEYIFLAT